MDELLRSIHVGARRAKMPTKVFRRLQKLIAEDLYAENDSLAADNRRLRAACEAVQMWLVARGNHYWHLGSTDVAQGLYAKAKQLDEVLAPAAAGGEGGERT